MLEGVKHIILILSGKGGVGKSTVSTQLALALKESGFKVGLLDIDLCGPSVPFLLQLEDKEVHQCPEGWVPVYSGPDQKLAVMSIGFLLKNRNDGVVWRGPKKTDNVSKQSSGQVMEMSESACLAMIRQFLTDVYWQDIDYLIIDTPPGTSDEHITVVENLRTINCDGAILVTTPQAVAIEDVRKELTFCRKTGTPILGVIENMSGFVCPTCSECTNIFSSGGGKSLSEIAGVPFLGTIPIDPRVSKVTNQSVLTTIPDSQTATVYKELVEKLTGQKISGEREA